VPADDGTHFESSTGYQRLCARRCSWRRCSPRVRPYLSAIPGARRITRSRRALPSAALAAMLKPSGEMPQIGESRYSCHAALAAQRSRQASLDALVPGLRRMLPEWAWLAGSAAVRGRAAAAERLAAGCRRRVCCRSGEAWMAMSAGPNGQGGTGGHAAQRQELRRAELRLVRPWWSTAARSSTRATPRSATRAAEPRATAPSRLVTAWSRNRIVQGRLFALTPISRMLPGGILAARAARRIRDRRPASTVDTSAPGSSIRRIAALRGDMRGVHTTNCAATGSTSSMPAGSYTAPGGGEADLRPRRRRRGFKSCTGRG